MSYFLCKIVLLFYLLLYYYFYCYFTIFITIFNGIMKNKKNKKDNIKKDNMRNNLVNPIPRFKSVERTVDKDGNTIELTQEISYSLPRNTFMRVYLDNIAPLLELNKTDLRVLLVLWGMAGYNNNEVTLVKGHKERMGIGLGYSQSNINNSISRLAKKEILIRLEKSIYILNPKYFFYGKDIARANVIHNVLTYSMTKEEVENEKNNNLGLSNKQINKIFNQK